MMYESQNLVVNEDSGVVHRKTCGQVNYLTMFTLPAKLFHTIGDQRDYSAERGWRECRNCRPFIGVAPRRAADPERSNR